MPEVIIIGKTISLCIEWRVNINQLHLSAELGFESVQGEQVVAFDNQVFTDNTVFIAAKAGYRLNAVSRIAFEVSQHIRVKQAVYLILRQHFVEENLLALFFFFGLPAF